MFIEYVQAAEESHEAFHYTLDEIDSKANQLARVHREIVDGYKLTHGWFRSLLIQVSKSGADGNIQPK